MQKLESVRLRCKVAFAALKSRWSRLRSPFAQLAVALLAALMIVVSIWAILQWLSFFLGFVLIAAIVWIFSADDSAES